MIGEIEHMLESYEDGRMTRRELASRITALVTLMAGAGTTAAAQAAPTFRAVGLNHIALSVTDIPRSRDFYVRHLGLSVSRETSGSCFLTCGENFVALFRAREPGMDHYCYAVADYDVDTATQKLDEHDLAPRVRGRRIYFDDPDGLEVQLAAADLRA